MKREKKVSVSKNGIVLMAGADWVTVEIDGRDFKVPYIAGTKFKDRVRVTVERLPKRKDERGK